MCSLATSTACWYSPSGIELLTLGQHLVGRRRLDRHVRQRPGEVGDGPLDAGRRRRRRRRRCAAASRPSTGTLSISVTRWRQWSNAASEPIMLITASGRWRSSGGHVGQPLDLADHVVAEVAHQPAVQRRQLGDHRRPVRRRAAARARRGCPGRAARRPAACRRRSTRPSRSSERGDRDRARRTRSGSSARRARPTRAGSPGRRRRAWRRRRPASPGRPSSSAHTGTTV